MRAHIQHEVGLDAFFFTTFSAHTKMAADKRGQIEVFARKFTIGIYSLCFSYIIIAAGWWFQTWFLYSIIYGIILPIDCHIFQRGRSTINQTALMIIGLDLGIWVKCQEDIGRHQMGVFP